MSVTAPSHVSLDQLKDDALVRVIAADPVLAAEPAAALRSGLEKLVQHFHNEGRLERAAVQVVADGAAILIAWEGPALSGCSHDKIAGLLAHHSSQQQRFLEAAPISVRGRDGWRCGTRSDLRAWLSAGLCDGDSPYLDRTVATLGDWRRHGLVPLAQSPLSRLLTRA